MTEMKKTWSYRMDLDNPGDNTMGSPDIEIGYNQLFYDVPEEVGMATYQ
jgi:hypothetical protein